MVEWLLLLTAAGSILGSASGLPTWPSSVDELEDIMFLNTGYHARAFAADVTPCTFSAQGPSRIASAEWLRTAFHDMATGSVLTGVGGLDASIQYELGGNGGENIGPGFNSTLISYTPFFSSRASLADLIALGVYASVRSCGGPTIPIRAGRIDATAAGPTGVPLIQNSQYTFIQQFARMGFNVSEMIALTVCGHTIGGVHANSFPQVVQPGTVPNDYQHFDLTTVFNQQTASDYVNGNTSDALAGPLAIANKVDSDIAVFTADNNATIGLMTDPSYFQSQCQVLLQQMIEVVPAGVVLTDPIAPYEVKPSKLQLTIQPGGTQLQFTGEIRIRTTDLSGSISNVQLVYVDRNGASTCGSCVIATQYAGTTNGFDDSFVFYSFSATLPAATSISSFTVQVTAGGNTVTYNNNGNGYPVEDNVIFQSPQSCIATTSDSAGNYKMTVTAAVRNTTNSGPPTLSVEVKTPRSCCVVPGLSTANVTMTKTGTIGDYVLFSGAYGLTSSQITSSKFSVYAGTFSDSFKSTALTGSCSALSGSDPVAYTYVGCYTDSVNSRTFTAATTSNNNMTLEDCSSFCSGYKYFGTEYTTQCFCGTGFSSTSTEAPETDCSMPCGGDSMEICGGPDRLSVYTNNDYVTPAGSKIQGYQFIGCYNDSVSDRSLSATYAYSSNMTVEYCATFCNGATYFGVEYYNECYCGDSLATDSTKQPITDCSYACSGNSSEFCGGSDRLDLYQLSSTITNTSSSSGSSSITSTTVGSMSTTVSSSSIMSTTSSTSTTLSTSVSSSSSTTVSSSTTLSTSASSSSSTTVSSSTTLSTSASSSSSTTVSSSTTQSTSVSSSSSTTVSSSTTLSTSASSSSSTTVSSTTLSTSASSSSTTTSGSTSSTTASSDPVSSSTSSISNPTSSKIITSSASLTSQTTTPASPSSSVPFVGWLTLGCYNDSVDARTLEYEGIVLGGPGNMTVENCETACLGEGYILAGVEYSGQCYCDNTLHNGGTTATDGYAQCTMTCNGNATEMCGGPNRLNMYQYNSPSTSTTASSITTTTSSGSGIITSGSMSSSVPSTTSTSATTTATGLPAGWAYQGCWMDNIGGVRAMLVQENDNPNMTIESCVGQCISLGYTVAGMEYSDQCFCDDYLRNNDTLASSDSQCAMTCAGDTNEICGGPNLLSVYSNSTITVLPPPVPQTTNLPGSWVYKGCLQDNVNNTRTFPYMLTYATNNSATTCLSRCQEFGFEAGGMEWGQQCFCGDTFDIAPDVQIVPDSECNMLCTGDSIYYCGAGNLISYYVWEGDTPLYEWTYASGNDAGLYEFLIGGVVVPLMTTVNINGKVTFVEKWGTGPPNSTGAYELDLFYENDFDLAWRTMHVKTDVFCSASLVLPDKVGRQINVGGWSGVSTEGVRLYWPDGSPGEPSVNDWQENASELYLQYGRWYPSAMIMANGSILIVGGETGSNGPPVPSIEILPKVGPTVYMNWLQRTDPNNLYPFMGVMPSKTILAAYYNEARLLDEATFETIRTLPNMPGAVNNDLGGRTYPLEGTMVFFPQYAPYTDPVGILVCGGSTPYGGDAIDNCVSIQPDVPGQNWTIERMPSKRVMSCISALPDGTYLILNGAHQGVAGFGLATSPNLNAVLYDPTKPVHHRMTVMANTTIARLYHSEAILLPDGRVLVSGSDPEDGVHPEEYRVEVFIPPYILSGAPRPAYTINDTDWAYGGTYTITVTAGNIANLKVSLIGLVSTTHGNTFGHRTIFPAFSCAGSQCTITAPPDQWTSPPGWFHLFILDGPTPSISSFVRIGGDPAELGNWPNFTDFSIPGI